MKLNVIKNIHIFKNEDVYKEDESWLLVQPDLPKEQLGLFNYWDEKKRKDVSDDATTTRLVLDYDDGPRRADVEEQFKEFEYIIYNSARKCYIERH